MGEQALYSVASQPVSSAAGLTFSSDYKKQQAMQNAGTQARQMFESVEAYKERMNQWNIEHAKKVREENTTTAEKKYREIAYQVSKNSTDPAMLQRQLGDMQALFRFANFNNLDVSFNNNLYAAQNQARLTENTLYKLKNGQNDNSGSTTNPMLYDGSYQEPGARDFLT